jgi:hypothetical protein
MATYNLKKDARLFLHTGGTYSELEVTPDLSFSQTFSDTTSEVKTLHDTDAFFGKSTITKANPANFEFTILIIRQNYFKKVHDLLLSADPFDLYVVTSTAVWRIQKAVITSGSYQIERSEPLRLNVNGQASKIYRYANSGTVNFSPLDQMYYAGLKDYVLPKYLSIEVGGTDVSSGVFSIKAELQNNIEWLNNRTLDKTLDVTDKDNAIFPQDYVVKTKSFAGSIGSYITDDNDDFLSNFDAATSLSLYAGEQDGNDFYGFRFNLGTDAVSFTNRVITNEVFSQSIDWKLVSNPALSTSIIYSTS